MPPDRDSLLALSVDDEPCSYAEADCMLYALGVGFAGDSSDAAELPYVYEGRQLRTVPTMANRFLSAAFLRRCGWNHGRLLHTAERLELYRPLPRAAAMLRNLRVVAVDDLGNPGGARIVIEAELRLAKDETVLATCTRTLLAPDDGGVGGVIGGVAVPDPLPERGPDLTCEFQTRPEQALLFRLVDTMNPIHADPGAASTAGFERPVLQGRCLFGIACRAVLKTICDYDFTLVTGFEAALAAPAYPGDTIVTEMWQDRNIVSFRCRVPGREAVVLDNGRCTLSG